MDNELSPFALQLLRSLIVEERRSINSGSCSYGDDIGNDDALKALDELDLLADQLVTPAARG